MTETGLVVSGLRRAYGSHVAVDGMSLAVPRGSVVALVGPNGAGKSTTLNCIAGYLRPDAGSITLDGRELGPDRSRVVTLVPEIPEPFALLTVWEHLLFVARGLRLAAGWEATAAAVLERFHLSEHRDKLGEALSKGMRQKLVLACAVLADNPLILLDEPMTGLDPEGQIELRKLITELRDQGRAVLVSSHMLASLPGLTDGLVILDRGRTVCAGTLEELFTQFGVRDVEELFLRSLGR